MVILLGPRQCGKTTLGRQAAQNYPNVHVFDLERPSDQLRLEQPMTTLEPLVGLLVIEGSQEYKINDRVTVMPLPKFQP